MMMAMFSKSNNSEGSKDMRDDDDDSSVCSTMPASQEFVVQQQQREQRLLQQELPSCFAAKKRRNSSRMIIKKVCFVETENVAHDTNREYKDVKKQWYTKKNYRKFHRDVLRSLLQCHKSPSSQEQQCDDNDRITKKPRQQTPDDNRSLLQSAFESCYTAQSEDDMNHVCTRVERLLTQWHQELQQHNDQACLTGLEIESHDVLFRDRDFRRVELWDTILWTQQEQDDDDMSIHDMMATGRRRRADMIRHACETISRTSRFWARSTALALQRELMEQEL